MDPVRILVLDRGFVLVARCPDADGYGLWLPLTDSRTVRRWGTSRGLGELAAGPTAETVLDDPVPAEKVPVRAVLRVIDPTPEGAERWAAVLTPTSSAARTRRSANRSSPTGTPSGATS